ncbi:hypothetical protein OsI_18400 [Oryza sativa Indica Group]|uniref:Uncharacterized protein n=1 Tax=Oryza sativa subsp. indica TaxID=39946 RepID=B8AXW1_ORYSI|nr:hypothetical protein OsI_18400 [Oryza sativa Indica Group]
MKLTAVQFIDRFLGGYEDPAQQIFLRAPEALMKYKRTSTLKGLSWWRRRGTQQQQQEPTRRTRGGRRHKEEKIWYLCSIYGCQALLGMTILAAVWLARVAAVVTVLALSWKRLKKQDYLNPGDIMNDQNQNITWSLNIFYSLVFAQGIMFVTILLNPLSYYFLFNAGIKYKLFDPSGLKIILNYKRCNYLEFIAGNVKATLQTHLVTFAKKLAVSNMADDKLLGVGAMDRILRSMEFRSLALRKLRAFMEPDELGKLVNMLGYDKSHKNKTTEEEDIRGHTARVVLKLSPDLLVQSYPQILYAISSSLLSTSKSNNKRVCKCNMDSDLVWFGLRILDKLTDNPENCRKATNDESGGDLLSTIIDLTIPCCHGHGHGRSMRSNTSTISDSWIEQEIIPLLQTENEIPLPFIDKLDQEIIVGMALNILSKLVAAPDEAGEKLRKETSKHVHFLTNTGMILDHVQATRVISCLAVDKEGREYIGKFPEIIKKLKDCLLSKTPYVNITKVAAKLLVLECTGDEQLLNQIQLFIEENRTVEDQSFSLPISAFIEELDFDQLHQPWIWNFVQSLDVEDALFAPRVNHSDAAAKALILLTTECASNVEAFLQGINKEELNKIVNALSSEDGDKEKRRALAQFEGRRNLDPETLRKVKKIILAEGQEQATGMHAKLLQNLRAYSGPKEFDEYMKLIDAALPKVLKAVVDAVATLEDPSSAENLDHVKDDMWIKQGKVLESFIGLAVQICSSPNKRSDFSTALKYANLTVDTLIKKLKKILEVYMSPSTDFPCIRVSTLELITWMVEENNSYWEILLQCGVYEELNEVARTARKLESFKLFHCGIGIPTERTIECISSLATKLQEKLKKIPDFERRYRYGEHASRISVLIA